MVSSTWTNRPQTTSTAPHGDKVRLRCALIQVENPELTFYLSGAQSRDIMAAYTASGDLRDSAALRQAGITLPLTDQDERLQYDYSCLLKHCDN